MQHTDSKAQSAYRVIQELKVLGIAIFLNNGLNKACAQRLRWCVRFTVRQGERFVHAASDIKRAARSRSMYKVIALTRLAVAEHIETA